MRKGQGRLAWRPGVVGLMAAMVGSAGVSAQDVGPLDQRGLRTSAWTILPSLALTANYNDNVFAVPDDGQFSPEADILTIVAPEVSVRANTRRHAFFLAGAAQIGRYADSEEQDFNDWQLSSGGTWDVSRTLAVNGGVDFSRTRESPEDPDRRFEEITERIDIDRFGANLNVRKDGPRSFAILSAGISRREFDELESDVFPDATALQTLTATRAADVNGGRNRDDYRAGLRLGYTPSRNYDLFVDLNYRANRFDEGRTNLQRWGQDDTTILGTFGGTPVTAAQVCSVLPQGTALSIAGFGRPFTFEDCLRTQATTEGEADRGSDTVSIRFGSALDFDRLVTGDIGVGVERTSFEDDREAELGFSFAANLDWTLSPRTSLRFSGSQGFEPSADQGGSTSTDLAVSLSHALSRQISLGADLAYLRDERLDEDRTDDDFSAGVSAAYNVNRHMTVQASYRYRQRNSTNAFREFTQNTVFLTLVGRY